jgi:predicted GH43/DUF377 family glycosyl hydrolase
MCLNSSKTFLLWNFLSLLFAIRFETYANNLRDLESNIKDFVLETKKIDIPNFPDALNPSVVRWNGSILMCFRIRDPLTALTNHIGMVWLDEEFNLISSPQILQMASCKNMAFAKTQDPRLINIGSDLFIVFNEFHQTSMGANRRMAYAKVYLDNNEFFTEPPQYLLDFENENPKKQEKNWVPFNYQGELLLSYSIHPHLVFKPIQGTSSCLTVSNAASKISWNWGIIRGGTPAEKIGNQYLAFFHSVKDLISQQSNGSRIIHYFMGAYTFNSAPPFNITYISPEPIVGKYFYNGPSYNTWKPLLVVFPGGYIHSENFIWIVYGRQDHETWVVKLDKKGLLNSLVPVSTCP